MRTKRSVSRTIEKLREWGYAAEWDATGEEPCITIDTADIYHITAFTNRLYRLLTEHGVHADRRSASPDGEIAAIEAHYIPDYRFAVVEIVGLYDEMWLK